MSWIVVVDPPASGALNMATDEALLEAADRDGVHALRLYAWAPATLSFGRNEPALRRYDRDAIAARALATVRRPTGGRAVWHEHEVTYAVAAPAAAFGSLRQSYLAIHTLLAAALNQLGAGVTLAPDRPTAGVGAGSCFASAAGGEVLAADGTKVVGSAQVRQGAAFLQHGSILLAGAQEVVAAVTLGAAAAPAASGLERWVGTAASFASVSNAVRDAAALWWRAEPAVLPAAVRARAVALAARYADAAWTWRR